MRQRVAGRACMAAIAAVGIAIVAAPTAGASAQSDPAAVLRAANEVLDAREAALGRGDEAAWMATIDPAAPAAFKDGQRRHFAGLRALPVERYALTARVDDTGDLAPEDDRFLPETRMSYRIGDFDDRDAVETLWLTFVLRDGRWLIASDTDVADLGLDTSRGLWDFGEVKARPTAHFLVLHHPQQAERAAALGVIADDASATLTQRWNQPWSGRLPIILPGSVEELEEILQSTIDLDKFVAFVSYGAVRDASWVATAPRMYIQDRNLANYGRAFQVETLVHELVHAASAPLAGPSVPSWLHEGVADWVATGRSTGERKPRGSDGVLPRDYEFTTGPQDAILRSYAESRSVISYLAARAGATAPAAFFVAAGEAKAAPGSLDRRTDDALRRATGIGLAELQDGWARR